MKFSKSINECLISFIEWEKVGHVEHAMVCFLTPLWGNSYELVVKIPCLINYWGK